ncbi:hypothetical protein D047_2730B, partial [Vibrio parahaemolyticus VPTS-2010_2]
DSMI